MAMVCTITERVAGPCTKCCGYVERTHLYYSDSNDNPHVIYCRGCCPICSPPPPSDTPAAQLRQPAGNQGEMFE